MPPWVTTINYCLANLVHCLTSLNGHLCCHCKASTAQKRSICSPIHIRTGPYIIHCSLNYLQWVKAVTSSLSLRCRKWCTIWSITCKGSVMNTSPTKVKGDAKTYIMHEPHQKGFKIGNFQNKLYMDSGCKTALAFVVLPACLFFFF